MSVDAEAPEDERADKDGDDGGTPPRGLALTARGRRVALAAAGALVLPVVVAVVALAGGGGSGANTPPASGAAQLVPANALVYVHLSTDHGRSATRDAAKVADRFSSWPAPRARIRRPRQAARAG